MLAKLSLSDSAYKVYADNTCQGDKLNIPTTLDSYNAFAQLAHGAVPAGISYKPAGELVDFVGNIGLNGTYLKPIGYRAKTLLGDGLKDIDLGNNRKITIDTVERKALIKARVEIPISNETELDKYKSLIQNVRIDLMPSKKSIIFSDNVYFYDIITAISLACDEWFPKIDTNIDIFKYCSDKNITWDELTHTTKSLPEQKENVNVTETKEYKELEEKMNNNYKDYLDETNQLRDSNKALVEKNKNLIEQINDLNNQIKLMGLSQNKEAKSIEDMNVDDVIMVIRTMEDVEVLIAYKKKYRDKFREYDEAHERLGEN